MIFGRFYGIIQYQSTMTFWHGNAFYTNDLLRKESSSHWTNYRQVSNIRRTSVGNKIDDHSDVVGASPVGAAPTTSSFST